MKKSVIAVIITILALTLCSCGMIEAETNSMQEAKIFEDLSSDKSGISEPDNFTENNKIANFYIENFEKNQISVFRYEYDGTIDGLIAKLIDLGTLPAGTSVISFSIDENTATIDLSKELNEAMIGTTIEHTMIVSLVNTVIDCYDLGSLNIKVEGSDFQPSHPFCSNPISFFNNSIEESS